MAVEKSLELHMGSLETLVSSSRLYTKADCDVVTSFYESVNIRFASRHSIRSQVRFSEMAFTTFLHQNIFNIKRMSQWRGISCQPGEQFEWVLLLDQIVEECF
ncbi:hypothetical protein SK128_013961 [Halocaridina rubra]|uniref:Uncharacterized protein n=1 Tax=Halocaridina rubra TaxID=373956 RepID=A0AAN8X965_HALRR